MLKTCQFCGKVHKTYHSKTMNNKEQIICKYKFQDKEKFDGKPYCTCFNELCEDISIICDHNCQIYEDYKQLARKTQECEQIKEKYEALKLENEEGYEIVDELKHEYEELKKEIINRNEKIKELRFSVSDLTNRLCCLNAEKSFRIVDLEQALEEIKKVCIEDTREFADGTTVRYDSLDKILDIINKAKGEGICQ